MSGLRTRRAREVTGESVIVIRQPACAAARAHLVRNKNWRRRGFAGCSHAPKFHLNLLPSCLPNIGVVGFLVDILLLHRQRSV